MPTHDKPCIPAGMGGSLLSLPNAGPPPPQGVRLDVEVEWRRRVAADPAVQELLGRLGPALRELHTPPTTGLMKARPPAWRFGEVYALLGRAGLLTDVQMPRLSEIVGDPATADAFHLSLTPQMVVRAWLAMRINPLPPGVRPPAPTAGSAVVLSALPHAKWMGKVDKGTADFINGGGLRPDEDGGGTTFEEWLEVLIRCGEARYRHVTCGLPPDDSAPPTATCAEAVLSHVAALRSEVTSLQEASRIPFPRIQFNEMSPRPGESDEDLARWKWLWVQLCRELDRVHLWPSWEPQAFEMLRTGFPRLQAIFSYYIKAGWLDTLDTNKGVTLPADAWEEFFLDCGFATAQFGEERLRQVYANEVERSGADGLHVIQFVGLLIHIAFLRIHPEHQVGDLDRPGIRPVPDCIRELLHGYVFPHARCDPSVESWLHLRAAPGVQDALLLHKVELRKLYAHLGGEVPQEGKSRGGAIDDKGVAAAADGKLTLAAREAAVKEARNAEVTAGGAPEYVSGVELDDFVHLMETTSDGWCVETLQQRSAITGEPAMRTEWSVSLAAQQAVIAYRDSRSVAEWWMTRLSFDSFVQAICRCGEAMFSGVAVMSAQQKIDGIIKLVLRVADRAAVVDQATFMTAPPRFDPVNYIAAAVSEGNAKAQYTGSSAVAISRWLECWAQMDLSLLHGYPTWDRELCLLLQPYFATLCRLYAAYAAPLPKSEADLNQPPLEQWSASLDMTAEQWAALVANMGIASLSMPTGGSSESLVDLLQRQPSMIDAEGNEVRRLPQFVSALLCAAFTHANPHYEAAAAAGDIDVDRLVPVPEAAAKLLEHYVPLTLMRRCLIRLRHDVDLAKALMNDKQARLQQARTRERNFAIEAAGAAKRQGNQQDNDVFDTPRRPLRHQAKLDAKNDKEKKKADPEELHADVIHRQSILDDFSRVLKRKQADLVLLQGELEPLLEQERREGAAAVSGVADAVVHAQPDDKSVASDEKPAATAVAKKAAIKGGAATATKGAVAAAKVTPPGSLRVGKG